MTWRWFRAKLARFLQVSDGDVQVAADLAALTAIADRFRDDRRWPQAAVAYGRVVQKYPLRAPIWVQFGHAQKEAGDLPGAETAYRRALALDPRNADCHVQLGHALKLQGQREAAIAAYAAALQVDRNCDAALHELLALGEGPAAGQASGLGLHGLQDVLATMAAMRRSLAALERALPDIASLASIAVGRYDLFRQNYRLPAPPAPIAPLSWAVVVLAGDSDCVPALRSLAAQTLAPRQVVIRGATAAAIGRAAQSDYYGLRCRVGAVEPRASQALFDNGIDWVLLVAGDVVLADTALAWLDWATANCAADAIYADEAWAGDDARGPIASFKAAYDGFAGAQLYDHAALAIRASALPKMELSAPAATIEAAISAVIQGDGSVGHLARVIAMRPGMPGPPAAAPDVAATAGLPGRICAIIPTRDGREMLRTCVAALRDCAARPDDLDIIVIDNGSVTPAMLEFLDQLSAARWVRILRIDEAFNWSRLNNAGAAASDAGILVFLNDDVEIITFGWDDILRACLATPLVGAVGARLNYPDGRLQHAGLVFGPSGRCEHEGVGASQAPPQIAARWTTRRQVGAVTGAFLACRRDTFDRVGGFDTGLPIWFNDVDFCLKLRKRGFRIIFEAALVAIHRESPTLLIGAADPDRQAIWDISLAEMRRRWGDAMSIDLSFNPHFSRGGRPFEALFEPSLAAVQAHLQRSGLSNPWLVA